MGDNRTAGNPNIRGHLEEPGVDEDNIMINLRKSHERAWTALICLRIRVVTAPCERY